MAAKSSPFCFAPLLLRVALGVIFIWAGAAKLFSTMPVKGQDAAILANLGVIKPPGATPPANTPAATPSKDAKPTGSSGAPNPEPKKQTSRPTPTEPLPASRRSEAAPTVQIHTVAFGQTPKTYYAEDFPDEVQVKPTYLIAVTLKKAAAANDADGKPVKPYWPSFLDQGQYPIYLAWACAITELAGGVFMIIGFLTRLSAFALAVNMGVAMWLTVFGPAISAGTTQYGFLPNHSWTEPGYWSMFQMQFVLFLVALAVVGIGAGRMSIDRILFPPPTPVLPPRPKPENAPDK